MITATSLLKYAAPPKAAATTQRLPMTADKYSGSIAPHTWVHGADAATYRRVCASVGGAVAAFSSHLLLAGGGIAVGVHYGNLVGGPIIGAALGGAVGLAAGALLQSKTMLGRRVMGRLGAVAGTLASPLVRALRIPLRSDHVEDAKDFTYKGMASHLGDINYTSHPHISPSDADAFIAQLQPGDLVLTNDEASTIFSLLVAAVNGKADFNHALVYQGNGKTIEARTVTHGVAEGDLKKVLTHKHHAVAVRPHYTAGQADAVVDAARSLIGVPYDFKFRLNNDALYCSELVNEAVHKGAPQVQFQKHPVLSRQVVLPGDILHTSQADVVAEVGTDRSMFNAYLGKFT